MRTFVCTEPPGTVTIPPEFKFIVQNYDNLTCSTLIRFSRKDLNLSRIYHYGFTLERVTRVWQWRRRWEFSEVKRLVEKWMGTRERYFRRKMENLPHCVGYLKIRKFVFYPYNHVSIFAPVHGLLERARTFGFELIVGLEGLNLLWGYGFWPILCWWRSILWRFPDILCFGDTESSLQSFSLHIRTAISKVHLLS
jgi:hypothetical protein